MGTKKIGEIVETLLDELPQGEEIRQVMRKRKETKEIIERAKKVLLHLDVENILDTAPELQEELYLVFLHMEDQLKGLDK